MGIFDEYIKQYAAPAAVGGPVGGLVSMGANELSGNSVLGGDSPIGGNPALRNFGNKLGFGTTDETRRAEEAYRAARAGFENLETPVFERQTYQDAATVDQGRSNFEGIARNGVARGDQMAQLAALRNIAARGGRSAAGDANLARISGDEAAADRGRREAIMQNAAARGASGSGATLMAQLNSAQDATNRQSMRDMDVAAMQQNNEMQALTGAANVSQGIEQNDYSQAANKAQAQDAINRFNAQQRTAMNQYNQSGRGDTNRYNTGLQQQQFQNQLSRAQGLAGTHEAEAKFNQEQNKVGAQQAGNIVGNLWKGANAVGGYMAAHGGRVPGQAQVPGDSYSNDSVPLMASPEEVLVPRTLAQQGSPDEVYNFVRNAPEIGDDRDARLQALIRLQGRR